MAKLPLPLSEGTIYDHQSLSVTIDGVSYPSISELSYNVSVDRGEHRGTSPLVQAYTDGVVTNEASFILPLGDLINKDALLDSLADDDGQWGTASFDVVATFKTRSSDEESVVTLRDCKIDGYDDTSSSGPDPNLATVNLSVRQIEENGNVVYADQV